MRAFRKNPAEKHHHADHQCQRQIKEKNLTGRNMRESINVGENGQD